MSWEAHPSGEGVRVVTANGIYEAGKIIISTGAWAPDLLRDLGVSLQVERHVQMFLNQHKEWIFFSGKTADLYLGSR